MSSISKLPAGPYCGFQPILIPQMAGPSAVLFYMTAVQWFCTIRKDTVSSLPSFGSSLLFHSSPSPSCVLGYLVTSILAPLQSPAAPTLIGKSKDLSGVLIWHRPTPVTSLQLSERVLSEQTRSPSCKGGPVCDWQLFADPVSVRSS